MSLPSRPLPAIRRPLLLSQHPPLLGRLHQKRLFNRRPSPEHPQPLLPPPPDERLALRPSLAVANLHLDLLVLGALGPRHQRVLHGAEQVAHGGDLGVLGVGVVLHRGGGVGGAAAHDLAHAVGDLDDGREDELVDVGAREGVAARGAGLGNERPVDDGRGHEDAVVEQLLDDAERDAGVRRPERHDGRDDLRAGRVRGGAGVRETVLGAFDSRQDVGQGLAADVEDRGDKDVGAGYQRVEVVVEGERVDALDDGLDLVVGCFFLEERGDLAALGGEGGVCWENQSARHSRKGGGWKLTIALKLELGHLLLHLGIDEMLVGLRQGVLDALGKAEPNLLVDGALDKRLLRVQVGQSHVVHPLGPFPGEAKVAQMVREPIEEAIAQLEIQSDDIPVQVPDGTSKARSDGRRRQLAGLRQDGVVVDELVLGSRQLEELGEDGIDRHIFGLPRRLRWLYVAKPIKGSGSSGKGPGSEVAVQIDQVAGRHVAIEVEDADCVGKRIADERRGRSRLGGDGLDLLAAVHGEVHIWEQGSRTGGEVGRDGDGREGVLGRIVELRLLLQLLDRELPGLWEEREGPSGNGLGLKLRL